MGELVGRFGYGRVTRDLTRAFLVVLGLSVVFAAVSVQMKDASAGNPPPEFADIVIADEIYAPISLGMAPDGRLIVLTDSGQAYMVKNDQLLPTPVFDIRNRVDDAADRGLQSIAFDNNFAVNGYIYVIYTFDTNSAVGPDDGIGKNRLVRFTMNGDVATNETLIFNRFPDADAAFHYGGAVEMGADGKLYTTVGDYLLGANGQDRTNIKSTVLRLNTNGTIPTDNPFYNELSGDSRAIYAYGLRNPWQTAKNPVDGTIYISDVGGDLAEELNVLQRGANYGWFLAEGPKDPNDPAEASFADPFWSYQHVGEFPNAPFAGCAIIGGTFYETPNPTFPEQYRGKYFTGDYCQGTINTVDPATGQAEPFMDGFDFGLVDMAVSPTNGDIYYIDQTFNGDEQFPAGGVGKISYVGPQTNISITTAPSDVSIAVGGDASFFVGVSAPGDVSYQWLRGGVPIPGETSPRLTIPNVSAADNFARFKVQISNGNESIRSESAVLRITNNTVPQPTISFGGADGGYRAGQAITFTGSATDAEDGTIPAADLRWEIRLNHDEHDHALVNNVIGRNGSFTVPPEIEVSTNVWVTLYLTATDSQGTSTTVTQRIDPKIVNITLASNPGGLQVSVDGTNHQAQHTFSSVVGVVREISAPATQTANGTNYTFTSWSHGGQRDGARATPNGNVTWTASFSGGGGGAVTCSFVVTGDTAQLTFEGLGNTNANLLRGPSWIANVTGQTSYTDNNAGTIYTLRTRPGGVVTDTTCTTGTPPTGDVSCSFVVTGNTAELTFEGLGNTGANLLRGPSWIANVTGQTSYTDNDAGTSYTLRTRPGGVVTDTTCTTGGTPPTNVCFVTTRAAGGVTITWQNKPGTEVLRSGGSWVATPPNGTLSFSAPNGGLNDGWAIRRDGANAETCQVVG